MRKVIINMKKPFEMGDVIQIARAEAQKKEHTQNNINITSIICTKACYEVYYEVQKS